MQKRLDVHKYFLDNNRYPLDADPKIIDETKKMYAKYLADKASEQPDTKIYPKCMEEIKYLQGNVLIAPQTFNKLSSLVLVILIV